MKRQLQVCAVDFTAYYAVAPLMRASREAGWDVHFACTDGPYADRLRAEGFVHHGVPMSRSPSPRRQLAASILLAARIRQIRPNLVHTHTPAGGIAGRAATLAWRGPVIHTIHGLPFEGSPRTLLERSYVVLEQLLSRRTTYFLSHARGDAARAAELGIARAEDTLVIGDGVDLMRYRPSDEARATTRVQLGLQDDAVVVLCVARLVREKGWRELAEAAELLQGERNLHYLLVGDALPSDRTGIAAELDAHPVVNALGPRWRRLGHRTDVDVLLQACDILVLPSYREGLPRIVIEAMAVGLPVVATDIPACRELVIPEETGLLVPVGDARRLAEAIRRLGVDREFRQRAGMKARTLAELKHDESDVLARQIAVFERLVA